MTFLILGFLTFLIFLPVCFMALFLVARKQYKNYSVLTFWISNLGAVKSRSQQIFNVCFLCFGLLSLFYNWLLFKILPQTPLTLVMLVFFSLTALLAMLIPFFPMDKQRRSHEIIASCLFIFLLITCLLFTYFCLSANFLPSFLAIFSLAVVIFSGLTIYAYFRLRAKYGSRAMGDLVSERQKETSRILKNATLWEWLVFFSMLAWLFVLTAYLASSYW